MTHDFSFEPATILGTGFRTAAGDTLTNHLFIFALLCVCAGEEIWVEDPKKVWALASLVSQHNTILKVKRKDTGEMVDIDLVSGRPTHMTV